MTSTVKRLAGIILGISAALVTLEAVARALATAGPPPIPNALRDSFDAPTVLSRQMEEGIAEARFSAAGARLTGNPAVPDAPVLLLLGDSYVVAREVRDEETMGAVVERLARFNGMPLNVRQYGWRGASAPQYLAVAHEMIERWAPDYVVIVLSGDDLGEDPLNRNFPRMTIDENDEVNIVPSPDKPSSSKGPRFMQHSVLATLIRARWQKIGTRAPRSVQRLTSVTIETRGPTPEVKVVESVPRATVKALSRAFGDRLRILYAADVRVNIGHKPEPAELRLLSECAQQGVRCASTRKEMLAAREKGVIGRGFSTTTIGIGHLNAAGHEMMARAIWDQLYPQRRRAAPHLASMQQK
ncbi:MAG TPA: hypothetical protein VM939_04260 [Gemmatimonadaceae bacterium]|nr:hypothetical protein [Gemmatimonadaceae bacterium]